MKKGHYSLIIIPHPDPQTHIWDEVIDCKVCFPFWMCHSKEGNSYKTLGMSDYNFQKILYSFAWIFFTFTKSVEPDEMQQYAAFHLGLH